jgi:hypothetical protein
LFIIVYFCIDQGEQHGLPPPLLFSHEKQGVTLPLHTTTTDNTDDLAHQWESHVVQTVTTHVAVTVFIIPGELEHYFPPSSFFTRSMGVHIAIGNVPHCFFNTNHK